MPLEAARRLAAMGHPHSGDCMWPVMPHDPECPYLALPAIVRALEAAERIARAEPIIAEGKLDMQAVCAACWEAGGHADDCPWQALVASLKGEEQQA